MPDDKLSMIQQSLSRNTMKRIKKMLVLKDPHFESLRSKFMCQAPVLYIAEDAGQDRKKGDEDAYLL